MYYLDKSGLGRIYHVPQILVRSSGLDDVYKVCKLVSAQSRISATYTNNPIWLKSDTKPGQKCAKILTYSS